MTPAVFAGTVFLSAALLFIVQPMTGKQLLPLAGGTPAVWTTCLVFFQAVLLLGYLYAHRLSRPGVSVVRQLPVHVGVMAAGLLVTVGFGMLEPDPGLIPDAAEAEVVWLVVGLAACVGGPFFVLSATAPLLQKWFAAADRRDPYPLYAASNAGSLVGLLGYPLVVEPMLPVPAQREWWVLGFAACLGLIGFCGALATFSPRLRRGLRLDPFSPEAGERGSARTESLHGKNSSLPAEPGGKGATTNPGTGWFHVLRWVGLAALTSSLLMSVTAYLTTDVAAVPLLWVVPLAFYLVSYIVVFARWPNRARQVVGRVTPMALCALTVALVRWRRYRWWPGRRFR